MAQNLYIEGKKRLMSFSWLFFPRFFIIDSLFSVFGTRKKRENHTEGGGGGAGSTSFSSYIKKLIS